METADNQNVGEATILITACTPSFSRKVMKRSKKKFNWGHSFVCFCIFLPRPCKTHYSLKQVTNDE